MTQIKNVNIVPDGSINRVHVSQGDIGRTLQFNLYDGALAYTPTTGSTIKIQGTKPSGFGFSEACSWSGNVVTVDTTEEMTDEYGYIDTELVITSSDESEALGTANFILAVEKNPHPDNITDGTQITAQSLEVRIEALEAEMSGGGMTDAVKQALLACFDKVAWIDENGQNYYDALEDALYPQATLTSISAVYTQSGTVYDVDSLDSLKSDLVVTAHWDDNTTSTVSSSQYTLSGTLTVGTSAVTVTYSGKTTTFNVTVSAKYTYDLTDGLEKLSCGTTPSASFGTVYTSGEIVLVQPDSTRRRSFPTTAVGVRCMKSSDVSYPHDSDLTDTIYYPIKIPTDATGVSVSITPSTQYLTVIQYTYDDTNHYTRGDGSGWQEGTATLSFTPGAYQYISVASKYNSSGTSYPTEPTALSVTFTTT